MPGIRFTVGEDCFICATVSGKGGSIEVNFDEDGKLVVGVYSFDKKFSDALGNNVGSSLRKAIESPTAQCESGIWTSCQSMRLNGLSYIVQDNDNCPILVCREWAKDKNSILCSDWWICVLGAWRALLR